MLVGAGGIGCELLKNLVKTGFGEIHLIDLDTIDLSNLNRQFLFRHEHIKKSKALVAKDVAQRFDPTVKIIPYHANIKDAQFTVQWFSEFTIVFNALDNMDARRHVNKMCLIADVPLIESGTTGYNGNVQVIRKGKTACYDCTAKTIPKSFPVCTIRSTPSQPIHCIVWAKSYLLPELFGASEDEIADLDTTANTENAEEIRKLKEESEALKKIKESMGSDNFAKEVFNKVYKHDVERLASMTEMWEDKAPPKPLDYDVLAPSSRSIIPEIAQTDQRVWSIPETFRVFTDSLSRLSKRWADEKVVTLRDGEPDPTIAFDKDDPDTLDFVTAAANLRSAVFAIEPKSKFDTKQMAGNIIPAIATTNAMIAALCVFQAYKIVYSDYAAKNDTARTDKYSRMPEVFLQKNLMRANFQTQPNTECPICSMAMARLQADLNKCTLKELFEYIQSEVGYSSQINILNDAGGILYDYMEAEDDEDAAHTTLPKRLVDLDVRQGSFLIIKDDSDENQRVDLQLYVENLSDVSPRLVHRGHAKLEVPVKSKKEEVEPNEIVRMVGKRKRSLDEETSELILEDGPRNKKVQTSGKINGSGVGDAIVVVDDNGAILIND